MSEISVVRLSQCFDSRLPVSDATLPTCYLSSQLTRNWGFHFSLTSSGDQLIVGQIDVLILIS